MTASTPRITVAQLAARMDEHMAVQDAAIAKIGEAVLALVQAQAQLSTTSTVAQATVTPIAEARTARTRKAPAKATPRKSAPAKKAAPAKAPKATKPAPVMHTLEQAQALVAGGESPWKVFVASSNTGEPVPFAKVARAIAAKAGEVAVRTPEAKEGNRELAAWLRGNKLPANGPVWDAAKAGERNVAKLRKLAA